MDKYTTVEEAVEALLPSNPTPEDKINALSQVLSEGLYRLVPNSDNPQDVVLANVDREGLESIAEYLIEMTAYLKATLGTVRGLQYNGGENTLSLVDVDGNVVSSISVDELIGDATALNAERLANVEASKYMRKDIIQEFYGDVLKFISNEVEISSNIEVNHEQIKLEDNGYGIKLFNNMVKFYNGATNAIVASHSIDDSVLDFKIDSGIDDENSERIYYPLLKLVYDNGKARGIEFTSTPGETFISNTGIDISRVTHTGGLRATSERVLFFHSGEKINGKNVCEVVRVQSGEDDLADVNTGDMNLSADKGIRIFWGAANASIANSAYFNDGELHIPKHVSFSDNELPTDSIFDDKEGIIFGDGKDGIVYRDKFLRFIFGSSESFIVSHSTFRSTPGREIRSYGYHGVVSMKDNIHTFSNNKGKLIESQINTDGKFVVQPSYNGNYNYPSMQFDYTEMKWTVDDFILDRYRKYTTRGKWTDGAGEKVEVVRYEAQEGETGSSYSNYGIYSIMDSRIANDNVNQTIAAMRGVVRAYGNPSNIIGGDFHVYSRVNNVESDPVFAYTYGVRNNIYVDSGTAQGIVFGSHTNITIRENDLVDSYLSKGVFNIYDIPKNMKGRYDSVTVYSDPATEYIYHFMDSLHYTRSLESNHEDGDTIDMSYEKVYLLSRSWSVKASGAASLNPEGQTVYGLSIKGSTINELDGDLTLNGQLTESSDERLKENIKPIEGALEKTLALTGVSYDRIKNGAHEIGFIAQEVEKVVPEVVATNEDGYKSVSYARVTALHTQAIKELLEKLNTLEERVSKLEGEIDG